MRGRLYRSQRPVRRTHDHVWRPLHAAAQRLLLKHFEARKLPQLGWTGMDGQVSAGLASDQVILAKTLVNWLVRARPYCLNCREKLGFVFQFSNRNPSSGWKPPSGGFGFEESVTWLDEIQSGFDLGGELPSDIIIRPVTPSTFCWGNFRPREVGLSGIFKPSRRRISRRITS